MSYFFGGGEGTINYTALGCLNYLAQLFLPSVKLILRFEA